MNARATVATAVTALVLALSGCAVGDSGGGTSASADQDAAGGAPARAGAPVLDGFSDAVVQACDAQKSPVIQRIQDRGVLQWGIGISPPFGFKDGSGNWAGVEADNAQELAAILGVDVRIQDYDYGVMTAAIASEKADIVGAQLFITPERAEAIDFSEPYYLSGQLFYVLEDSPYQSIEDLNQPDVRFVYGTGGGQKLLAEKYIPKAKISDAPLRGQLLLYEFLASGQADVSMVEAAPMPVLLEKYRSPQLAAIGLNGRVAGERATDEEIIDPFDVAFGLPKGDAGWKGCVDAWVEDAKASGRMTERIEYWLDQNIAG